MPDIAPMRTASPITLPNFGAAKTPEAGQTRRVGKNPASGIDNGERNPVAVEIVVPERIRKDCHHQPLPFDTCYQGENS